MIDWCRDSAYSIADQVEVLDDIASSVGVIESQISEVQVKMTTATINSLFCDIISVLGFFCLFCSMNE